MRATRQQAKALQLNLEGGADQGGRRARPQHPEEMYQALLFARRDALQGQYHALGWLFATLNGVYLPPALKARVKASGLTRGVLDVWLPIRRIDPDASVWSGVVIDLKRKKGGAPSKEQLDWARLLAANGWRVYFCAGTVDAWRVIASYLGIVGEDHVAADLMGQERYVQQITNDF